MGPFLLCVQCCTRMCSTECQHEREDCRPHIGLLPDYVAAQCYTWHFLGTTHPSRGLDCRAGVHLGTDCSNPVGARQANSHFGWNPRLGEVSKGEGMPPRYSVLDPKSRLNVVLSKFRVQSSCCLKVSLTYRLHFKGFFFIA